VPARFLNHLIALIMLALASLLGVRTPLRGVAESGEILTGRPEIIDGDSLRLSGREVRLAGIDAPEIKQDCERAGRNYPCGRDARRALVTSIGNNDIICQVKGLDRYGRSLAKCTRDGRDLGAELVSRGFAIAYGDYDSEEAQARHARLGVWAGNFERPADWRRRHPRGEY
jgi:endonuclease YncB( thermonuclease family)